MFHKRGTNVGGYPSGVEMSQIPHDHTKSNLHYFLITLIATILICIYWSIISLLKYFYFQATIFDLGVAMQNLWNITHIHWTFYLIIVHLTYQGIAFLLFPLQYIGYVGLLLFQAIIISLGSITVLLIAINRGINRRDSMFISISYLLYFPLSSLTWFDFHFQSLFPTFFLLSYFLYLKQKYWLSSIFFIISGLVRFPYIIFPLCFWVISFVWDRKQNSSRRFPFVYIINILLLSLILIVSYIVLRSGAIEIHTTQIHNPLYNLPIKLVTIVVIFAPVLFTALFSRKWVIFTLPFISLMFVANNPVYEFPYIFLLQYSASFIPFIFLGVIDTISKPKRMDLIFGIFTLKWLTRRKTSFIKGFQNRLVRKTASAILVAVICSAVLYQSIGPLAKLDNEGLSLDSVIHLNNIEMSEFNSISSLIPQDCPYVLIQNNLPQYLPGISGNNIRIPGFIGPNITMGNIANNSYEWRYSSYFSITRIDYVLEDVGSYKWFKQGIVAAFPGMANLSYEFIKSGYYGILGEDGPFIVLKRGYNGFPLIYRPYFDVISGNSLQKAGSNISNYIISKTDQNETVEITHPFSLGPGSYRLNLTFSSTHREPFWLGVIGQPISNLPNEILNIKYINALNISNSLINFQINNTYLNVYVLIGYNNGFFSGEVQDFNICESKTWTN